MSLFKKITDVPNKYDDIRANLETVNGVDYVWINLEAITDPYDGVLLSAEQAQEFSDHLQKIIAHMKAHSHAHG